MSRNRLSLTKVCGLLCLATSLAAPQATAETHWVAQRSLAIDPPASYCEVDRSIAAENNLFEFIEQINAGLNRVLIVFVDCKELVHWRSGQVSMLQRYGQVLTPIEEVAYRGMSRDAFIDQLQNVMGRALPAGLEAGRARMEAVVPNLKAGQTESLGVLGVDDHALYAGIAQKMDLDGQELVMAGVFAMTLMKEIPISVNLYRPYQDRATIKLLAVEQQQFLEQLLQRNDNLETRRGRPAEDDAG